MNVRRHPSPQVRSDYATSILPPGAALAVQAHLKLCPACAFAVETMGGAGESLCEPAEPPSVAGLAEALESRRAGPWRFLAPGQRLAALQGVSGLGEAVHLMRARRGARMRLKVGVTYLLVLEGGVRIADQSCKAGDFVEVAAAPPGRIVADPRSGCTLMVVSDDDWPSSWLRRFLGSCTRGEARGA